MTRNPFLSVWTQPKETVREVLGNKGFGFTVAVAGAAGIGTGLVNVQDSGFEQSLPVAVVFLLAVLLGAAAGIAGAFIAGGLYTMVGKWFGGSGNYRRMFIAMAPCYIPQIAIGLVYIVVALIYGEQFLQAPDPDTFEMTTLPMSTYMITLLLSAVFGIWGVVITAKAIGIVHGFSSWKGLGVILSVAAVIFVIVLIIGLIVLFSIL
ncbi:YIP1 family protein [Jeotgalibacillus sp. ET6]|uniref:YIP1 family protein n=1 Tax=Jeotgalibacillus sp. ET6 TaxID=3037260 RepID=UPI0024187289|nr:YIP1 family protein [Jeotgalibacillus sp. ET6]MDG5472059.1 YIP1 family protein [Jeotgalibacillus sp. ET6]